MIDRRLDQHEHQSIWIVDDRFDQSPWLAFRLLADVDARIAQLGAGPGDVRDLQPEPDTGGRVGPGLVDRRFRQLQVAATEEVDDAAMRSVSPLAVAHEPEAMFVEVDRRVHVGWAQQHPR